MADNIVPFPRSAQVAPQTIELAKVLPGAKELNVEDKGVNDTYHGEILLASGDTILAFIKDLDATELVKELLTACTARSLGMPVPRAFLALVQSADLAASKAPVLENGSRLVFASEDADAPSLKHFFKTEDKVAFEAIVNKLAAWPDLFKLYCLDSWFANIDRNYGNLLIGVSEIWLIDHGRVLGGPAVALVDLEPGVEYPGKLAVWLTPAVPDSAKVGIIDGAEALAAVEDRFLDELPTAAKTVDLTSAADSDAVVGFLKERRAQVRHLVTKALGMLVA